MDGGEATEEARRLRLAQRLAAARRDSALSAQRDAQRRRSAAAAATAGRSDSLSAHRKAFRKECRALALAASNNADSADTMMASLHRTLCMSGEETRAEIRRTVSACADPLMAAFMPPHDAKESSKEHTFPLQSVQVAVRAAMDAHRAQPMIKCETTQNEFFRADRECRVRAAWATLPKALGDVSALRHVTADPFEISLSDEVQSLRARLQTLHAEESLLLCSAANERLHRATNTQTATTTTKENDALRETYRALCAEAEAKTQALEEILAIKEEAESMPSTSTIMTGSPAARAYCSEMRFYSLTGEVQRLRNACEAQRRHVCAATAEKNRTDAELTADEAELTATRDEKQKIAETLRAGLCDARAAVVRLRCQQRDAAKGICALRDTMRVARAREKSLRQSLRARLLAAAAHAAAAESVHARLAAQLQWERNALTAAAANREFLQSANDGRKDKTRGFDRVVALAKERARYSTGRGDAQKEGPHYTSSAQLQECVIASHDKVVRLRSEIALRQQSQRHAKKETMRVVAQQLAALRMREETVAAQFLKLQQTGAKAACATTAGIATRISADNSQRMPFALPEADALRRDAHALNAAVAHALHREGRAKTVLRMLRETAERRERGEDVECLRIAHKERKKMKDDDHYSNYSSNNNMRKNNGEKDESTASTRNSICDRSVRSLETMSVAQTTETLSPAVAQRQVVLQFIKNEIQPLYNTNQISRVRFIEVVEKVSRWFLETNAIRDSATALPYLTSVDQENICQRIQETLTWQDKQRL